MFHGVFFHSNFVTIHILFSFNIYWSQDILILRCLQEYNRDGVIKSIGVSNYNKYQLQDVLDLGGQKPQVNQVYKTPLHDQVLWIIFNKNIDFLMFPFL